MRSRRLIKASVLLLLLLAVAGTVLWRMTWAAPAWYRPAAPNDPAVAALAEAVENRIIEEAYKVRPTDDPWTLRVRSEQVNAWLTARMPRWLVHEQDLRWPEQLGPPQLRLTRDGVELALQLSPYDRPRIIALRVIPSIAGDRLFVRFDRLSLGRIAMPGYGLEDLVGLAERYGAAEVIQQRETQWLLALLGGSESLEPFSTLADGRRVVLLEIRLGNGSIDLKLQTLPPLAPRLSEP